MVEMEFNKIFARNLHRYLAAYEMSQLDLSKKLGVSASSVSNWYQGLKTPRMDKVDAMCRIFHCRRADLMEDHGNNPALLSSFALSPLEKDIVTHYRAADSGTQGAVRKLLDVDEPVDLPAHLLPVAAHAEDGATREDLEKDAAMLREYGKK